MTSTEEFVRSVLRKQKPDEATVREVARKIDAAFKNVKGFGRGSMAAGGKSHVVTRSLTKCTPAARTSRRSHQQ